MPTWNDTTTYSRSDPYREPRVWQLDYNGLPITVHRHRDYGDDTWLLSCTPTRIADLHRLESTDLEDAKAEAIEYVRTWLKTRLDELPNPDDA